MADLMKVIVPKRDIARELARKYSTMTHDELDVLEDLLVPVKYGKGERILSEGEVCTGISYIEKGLVRQYYIKNGKEVTEHLGVDHSIFMCIESLFKRGTFSSTSGSIGTYIGLHLAKGEARGGCDA